LSLDDLAKRAFLQQKPATPESITVTFNAGSKLVNTDYISEIRKIPSLEKYLAQETEMNLYKRGWRFQFGNSREWAGLCAAKGDKEKYKSSVGKNIFVSAQVAKSTKGWIEEQMEDTIYHEIAHAIVREIFYSGVFGKPTPGELASIDPSNAPTEGHGVIWEEIGAAIAGKKLSRFFKGDFQDSFKKFRYICNICSHKEFGENKTFARKCSKCNSPVFVENN